MPQPREKGTFAVGWGVLRMLDRTVTCWILAGLLMLSASARGGPSPESLPQHPPELGIASAWAPDPQWMSAPPAQVEPPPQPQSRPEPIPLPAAAVVGPFMLTALIASVAMKKKRRTRLRVLR